MMNTALRSAVLLLLVAAGPPIRAEDAEPAAPSLPPRADEGGPVEELQGQIDELKQALRAQREEQARNAPRLSVGGYADVGFFVPLGNGGVGWVRDAGNAQFPEHARYGWVFLGDILATSVNTRGEAADLGDAPGARRFDSVDSNGAPGFLVNEINLRLGYHLADRALLRTSVDFLPRSAREEFSVGDFVDVDLAELEYVVTEDGNTSFFVGKTLPVFGIEYKERKSDQRFGVTPSLMHRYTSGPQLGAKVRSKLLDEWVILAAAISNNSSVTEQFHFHTEIDTNRGKTLSGRAALGLPLGRLLGLVAGDRLELGASVEWGPQDRAADDAGKLLFWGADLQLLGADYAVKAQLMRGEAPGSDVDRAWALALRTSGYVEANWQALSTLGLLARAGLRDADVTLATERIYVTRSLQLTGGVRVVFNENVVLKAEYVHNREFGGIAEFANDVFTSSLVLKY